MDEHGQNTGDAAHVKIYTIGISSLHKDPICLEKEGGNKGCGKKHPDHAAFDGHFNIVVVSVINSKLSIDCLVEGIDIDIGPKS